MTEEKIFDLYLPYPKMEDRLVRVYVPKHEDGEKLPVIYMTDGQNLFEEEKCRYGCWHIREAVREEFEKSGKSAVIVGIYNDRDPQRGRELTPRSIGKLQFRNFMERIMITLFLRPNGEVFDEFVIKTVKPYVEKNFPVKTGRDNTAFCGSSMGGLMSFFEGINNSDVFCMAGVFSPNITMYSKEDIKKWILSKTEKNKPYLYMYMGNGDDMEKHLYPAFVTASEKIKEIYPKELLKIIIKEDGKHNEAEWEPIFRDFLHEFLATEINF